MSQDQQPGGPGHTHESASTDAHADGHLFELLHQLITPGPASPFGELGLEGFVREFWAGFTGGGEASEVGGDWARLRAFQGRFLNTAALGGLISRTRINAERAIECIVAEATAEEAADRGQADPTRRRPVMVDAAFLKTHGWTLLAALAGALTEAIAADASATKEKPRLRLPRLPLALRRPWRFDVMSIAEAAIGGIVATGRSINTKVGAKVGALAHGTDFRAIDVPHLMALAATMLPFITEMPEDPTMAVIEDEPDPDEEHV